MPLSLLQRAKRAFVSVLLKLAFDYGVAADVNRDSDDKVILQSDRRVIKKVHPDKGGNKKKFQALQSAKEAWDKARRKKGGGTEGSKKRGSSDGIVARATGQQKKKGFRRERL